MDQQIKNKIKKYYVIDHQDGPLSLWSKYEYLQIMDYLSNSKSKAIITNIKSFSEYPDTDNINEIGMKMESRECAKDLQNEIDKNLSNGKNSITLVNDSIIDIITKDKSITINDVTIERKKICLLDMRAIQPLSVEDEKEFDLFIFGGILGENPPQDRTGYLRNEGFKTRNLGRLQMSTDCSVLCTKLIIENGISLENLPFINEPEFYKDRDRNGYEESVPMTGFRFISNEIDPISAERVQRNSDDIFPLGNSNIYENLIFKELSLSIFN